MDVWREPLVREVVSGVLGPGAFCVRGLFLDRSPRASWRVPWHQDATVTVKGRIDVTGFGPWTMKGGVQHVMAPPGTLSAMLTMRIHLDDCGEGEGMLSVIPASHQYGRLPEDSIEPFTRYSVTPCPVRQGGLVALHPLLLRKPEAPTKPGARRVLQLDFAARRLPLPLEWHETYPLG
jgi:ectoine hydroxylase-related dioxygenase (phytanoyl-CoA dioxygenase family)